MLSSIEYIYVLPQTNHYFMKILMEVLMPITCICLIETKFWCSLQFYLRHFTGAADPQKQSLAL